jgi:SRSO17 transposase
MGNRPIQTQNMRKTIKISITHIHESPPPRGWTHHKTLYFYTYADMTIDEWLRDFNEYRRPESQLFALLDKHGVPYSGLTRMEKGRFYV